VEPSILKSVKKILGLDADYTAFDIDIVTHINTTFTILQQLGIGPVNGFAIEDDTATWDTYLGTDLQLNSVKSYVYLRVRLLFDPPAASFHTEALKQQIQELEWRLNVHHEEQVWVPPTPPPTEEEVVW
jgi:hypothetical protein